jgi:ribosomal protein S18 acetylase RimI-like enzyme
MRLISQHGILSGRQAVSVMTAQSPKSRNIRRAGRADLAVVQQISADAYTPAYMAALGYIPKPAEEDYGPRIDRGEVWILDSDGRDIGIAVLDEQPDHLLVYSIAVSPAEQRQGYGRALLELADQRAIAIGVDEIRLYTNVRMQGNIALYRRHGYVAVGTRPHPSRAGEALVDMMRRVEPSVP